MTTATTTNNNKLKYVFPLKSSDDLTIAIRLIEVLGLKQGDYKFNNTNGSLEVIRNDNSWEEFLTNKIKELGFEGILEGKSYSSKETKNVLMSDTYTNLDSINKLHNKIYETYGKGNKINITSTEIDHIKSNVTTKFTITTNNNINEVDYAVALSIYNRQYNPIDVNGMPVITVDDLINSISDEEIVKTLKVLKGIFF